MNFNGKATVATLAEIEQALAELLPGVDEAAFNAVIKVETGGPGFDKAGRPQALFERHIFYRELQGVEREAAVKAGLAYPHWHTRPYPNSSNGIYAEIAAACAIHEEAALRSTSWGAGQIMGSEFAEAGFTSPIAMVSAFCDSELAQIRGMMKLIKARGLDLSLEQRDWPTFADRYNGHAYKANQYDTKLAAAFASYRKGGGPNVFAIQRALAKLHLYEGAIDGAAGPVTKGAIIKFEQADVTWLYQSHGDVYDTAAMARILAAAAVATPADPPSPAFPLPLPAPSVKPPLPKVVITQSPSGTPDPLPPVAAMPLPHDMAAKAGLGALLVGAMAYFKSSMDGTGIVLVVGVALVAMLAVYLIHQGGRHLP